MERYQVVFDDIGGIYWVIDTTIEDGEPCNVGGSWNKLEAQEECNELNRVQK